MNDNAANIISIGETNIEWTLAKGRFKCTYAIIEDLNPFDRVICGILYRKGSPMPKEEIARLLGFNSIDDPKNNLYVDKSEWRIFCDAIESLIKYNLVEETAGALTLTTIGKDAIENKYKRNLKEVEVTLWDDEFGVGETVKELLTFQSNYDSQNPNVHKLLNNPMDLLSIGQFNFAEERQSNIIGLTEIARWNYTVKVPFNVYYDFMASRLIIELSKSAESQGLNILESIISDNDKIRQKVLQSLFKDAPLSIINKPIFQLIAEINEDKTTDNASQFLVYGKNQVYEFIQSSEMAGEVFFFINTLEECDVTKLINLANSLPYRLVFVEYCHSFDATIESSNNICFRQSHKLRSSDFCVLSHDSFFSKTEIVVPFNDEEYSMPVFKHETEDRYRIDRIREPFREHFSNQLVKYVESIAERIENNPSANAIRNIIQLYECVKGYDVDLNTIAISRTLSQIKDDWRNRLVIRAEELKNAISSANVSFQRVILNGIVNDSKGICDNDLAVLFEEIESLIESKCKKPAKVKEYAYILDASVLMDMPEILSRFNRTHERIFIPRAMEQEIDGLAHNPEKRDQAKAVQRFIRRYKSDYSQVVKIYDNVDRSLLPIGYITPGVEYQKDNDMLALMIELSNKGLFDKVTILAHDKEFTDNVKQYIEDNGKSDTLGICGLNEFLASRETESEDIHAIEYKSSLMDMAGFCRTLCDILEESNISINDMVVTNATVESIENGRVTLEIFDGRIFFCPCIKVVSQNNMYVNQKGYACISHSGQTVHCVIAEMSYEELLNIFEAKLMNVFEADNYCYVRNIFRYLKKILKGQSRKDLKTLRKEITAVYQAGQVVGVDNDEDEDDE